MASSQGYLDHVLDLLSGVEGLTVREMMGEYLLYSEGALFGGVYDDRLLIKETPASASLLGVTAVPYEGARPMRLVDSDDGEMLSGLIAAVCADLRSESAGRPADDCGDDLRPLRSEGARQARRHAEAGRLRGVDAA